MNGREIIGPSFFVIVIGFDRLYDYDVSGFSALSFIFTPTP